MQVTVSVALVLLVGLFVLVRYVHRHPLTILVAVLAWALGVLTATSQAGHTLLSVLSGGTHP